MTDAEVFDSARIVPIRVVIVDDQALFREGLSCLLQGHGAEVVGQAADGAEALEVVGRALPDVVIMDVQMPTMGGVEATRRIVAQWPKIKVVGLSMEASPSVKRAMLAAGASSHLDKAADHKALVKTLEGICQATGAP